MFKNRIYHAIRKTVYVSCISGACLVVLARFVCASPPALGTVMTSTGTCAFSQQLQSSQKARNLYVTRLAKVAGYGVGAGGAVDEMYGNVEQASYDGDDRYNVWGFENKTASSTSFDIDTFSLDCISCHDGSAAVSVNINYRNNPFSRRSGHDFNASDHPIGMYYASYMGRDFKPVMEGANGMMFVNGKVGCLTCHNPLNQEKGHLVMSDRNSALCRSCHNM